ncbi:hypothetical protein P7K49_004184, partial [Saguinus oedipus]
MWPGPGVLRMQLAPLRGYLGRERRWQAGRGRRAWLERAGRGPAGTGAGHGQVTPTTSTLHSAPGS